MDKSELCQSKELKKKAILSFYSLRNLEQFKVFFSLRSFCRHLTSRLDCTDYGPV